MKHTVCQLFVFVSFFVLSVMTLPVSGQTAAAPAAKETATAAKQAAPAAVPAKEADAKETASAKETAPEKDAATAAAERSGAYQYFEYQVIAVPKKVLAAAARSMKLPEDSQPTDELLPAIYKEGGYRVIGYSAGYSAANSPVAFKMSRSEYFPDFYIMPKSAPDIASLTDRELPPPDMDDEDEEGEDNPDVISGGSDVEAEAEEDGDGEDDGDGSGNEDAEDDDDSSVDNDTSYNNLASIFPFFGDPSPYGNEFFLDIRPPRVFSMESSMRKLTGFTNTEYGDWGRGQSPIFDDNSFSSALAATGGKPMIVAKAASGTVWTLHVFYTKALPAPEKTTPSTANEKKLVNLDFQIVRARWNDICVAGSSDGCPAVPSDDFMKKLLKSNQLRDLYSPSFRLIPSQEPVSIQLNTKTQFVPLKWAPGQNPGDPAEPLDTGTVWTGTALRAAARILSDEKTVQLDYSFEKATQTGWRNYQYSFYGNSHDEDDGGYDPMDRYARPQSSSIETEILSSTLKLPMLDTTSFRQTLYLELGKPVLAARISNPAYQPDMLTLLFVTATVEDEQQQAK